MEVTFSSPLALYAKQDIALAPISQGRCWRHRHSGSGWKEPSVGTVPTPERGVGQRNKPLSPLSRTPSRTGKEYEASGLSG